MPLVSLYEILPYPLSLGVYKIVSSINKGITSENDLEKILTKGRLKFSKPFKGKDRVKKYIRAVIRLLRSMGWKIPKDNGNYFIESSIESVNVYNIKGDRFVLFSDTHHPYIYEHAFQSLLGEEGILIHLGDVGELTENYFYYLIAGNHDLRIPEGISLLGRMVGAFKSDGYLFVGIHDVTFTFLHYYNISRPPEYAKEIENIAIILVSHSHRGFFRYNPPTFVYSGNDFLILPVGTLSRLHSDRAKYFATIDYNVVEIQGDGILIRKESFGRIPKKGKGIEKRRISIQSKLFYN